MFPIQEFEKRFREILADLDALRDGCSGDAAEAIEEMNAEYEDALFVIECTNADDEDWVEEFTDALEEFEDLLEEYRALEDEVPNLADALNRLDMAIQMAEANLKMIG